MSLLHLYPQLARYNRAANERLYAACASLEDSEYLGHFFNHQTHHRGQVHAMLAQTTAAPPSLDMHRILNP